MHSANFWCGEEFFRLTQLLGVQKSVKISECLLTVGRISGGEPEKFSDCYIRHVEPTSQHSTVLYVQIQMTVCYELTLFGFVLNDFLCNVEYKFVSIIILSLQQQSCGTVSAIYMALVRFQVRPDVIYSVACPLSCFQEVGCFDEILKAFLTSPIFCSCCPQVADAHKA